VTKHCVAFADEALHDLQLGTLCILAGGFVSKSFVQRQPFDLLVIGMIGGKKGGFLLVKEKRHSWSTAFAGSALPQARS
jgi:hypothetical protein